MLSCNQSPKHTVNQRLFGAEVEINIYTPDRSLANRALEAVTHDLKLIDGFTDAEKAKPLSRVNVLLQSGEWFSVNPSLYELIQLSRGYFQRTGGAFNPVALGALRQAWGFNQGSPTPDLKTLNHLLKQDLTMNDIEIKGIRMRGRKAELKLDFDLLAVGYAIDSQLEHLGELGIGQADLRIGPVTGTLGTAAQTITIDDRYNVALEPGEALCRFSARDSRFPEFGRIDPRSAWPVKPIPTIVVIHHNARAASVACATLSIAGEDEWDSLVQNLGLTYAWWRNGDHELITAAMRSRLNES